MNNHYQAKGKAKSIGMCFFKKKEQYCLGALIGVLLPPGV